MDGGEVNSTPPNMSIREPIYFVETIKLYFANEDICGTKRIAIPTPRYVVIYTGQASRPEK